MPSTSADVFEILRRQNHVASVLFGLGGNVTAWMAFYGGDSPVGDEHRWAPTPLLSRWDPGELEALEGVAFFERALSWAPGAVDRELKLIARDELASLTIFSPSLGSALCPYDGGMDVFVKSADLLLALRNLFPHWLSTHPDGL